ncbi:holin [Sediminibacillus massiliensis]|uniref:holin n=1 Tax=Sediminibacillus massiliensis TaxID=1926277 RepID=UPI0009885587|nr:holin [Sediminibacillus massiliensis]
MDGVMMLATIIMPMVTALVELVKRSVNMPKNIVPAVSFVIGVLVGAAAYPFTDMEWMMRLWAGGYAGLAGTGLFEIVNKREGMTKVSKKKKK